jgi:diacylglycerol kinase family enzyme
MSDRCTLIVNPVSGGYSETAVRTVMDGLRRSGLAPDLLLTGGPDDAAAFAARLCAQEEHPFVIAVGGDGTVNGVLNGLEPGRATLGYIPFGTANVLGLELGLRSVEDAVARAVRRQTRPLATGLLEGFGVRRRFFLMAGIGFDGQVVEGVRSDEKKRFGAGAYLLSAFRTFADWDRRTLDVETDGVAIPCHGAVICNAARYGGNFALAPGASLFQDGFRVVLIQGTSRCRYFSLALRVAAGRGAGGGGVSVVSARRVTVGGNKPVQVDGDFICHTPVTVTAEADFTRLVV